MSAVGSNFTDIDGADKITGTARYTSDFTLAGMLHARLLRSPHPHARIVSIDASAALAIEGVVAVLTGADLQGLDHTYGEFIRDQPAIAVGKVRYAGEPVAAVAAITEAQAWRAVEALRVEYEVLAPVDSIEAALAKDAPALFEGTPHPSALPPPPPNGRWRQEPAPNVLYDFDYETGDIDAAFAAATHVWEDRFQFARLSHYALEPHTCIANAPTAGGFEMWSNNQDAFLLRRDLARVLGMPEEQVRIHAGLVGGGFGSKSYCKTEPIAALLARKCARPVRLALTLAESMLTVCEHAAQITVRSAVSASGKLLARDTQVLMDGGAYAEASPSVATRVGARMAGPYLWDAVRTKVSVVRTNSVPAGSFRGFGSAHVAWASESQIDMIAQRLGLDPVTLRMQNFIRPGMPGAPGEGQLDCDLAAGLTAALARAGHPGHNRAARLPGRGIGVAVAVKGSSGKYHRGDAALSLYPSGRIVLGTGATEIGQNTRTALVQIAAEELGVEPAVIEIGTIDTHATPYHAGTHASTGVTVSGLAVRDAAAQARDALLAFAGKALGCDVSGLAFREGKIWRGESVHTLAAITAGSAQAETPFTGTASIIGNSGWMPIWTVAEVQVDIETGACVVKSLVSAVDAGRAINPQRCVSQIEGGAVQGLGQALFEELQCLGGMPLNATGLGYRIPRTSDVPGRFETIILEQGGGPGPYGAKGLGESGNLTIPAAIANAIANATGARVCALPITPERVLAAMPDTKP